MITYQEKQVLVLQARLMTAVCGRSVRRNLRELRKAVRHARGWHKRWSNEGREAVALLWAQEMGRAAAEWVVRSASDAVRGQESPLEGGAS